MNENLELRKSAIDNPKDWRVYKISGVDRTIVARKGGPSANDIKSKESYQELRNNQKEFGVASMMARTMRMTMTGDLGDICETYSSGKLTAKFRGLVKGVDGPTGRRPLTPSKYGKQVEGFEFNPEFPFGTTFYPKYFVHPGQGRGHVILHFPGFVPQSNIAFPAEATHFKLTAKLVSISDFYFDEEEASYRPCNPDHHGLTDSFESNMFPDLKIAIQPITAQLSIVPPKGLPEKVGVFLLMGVKFYKYENAKYTFVKNGSSCKVLKSF
ncbi:MAG: hypothetical protein ACMVP2_27370 [Imperialibacter sp.]|uniref:hypothetical protein n=1 Tax=Imperialibacter sp. TaxID=2038411 RepID=UPI0030D898D4|tara:strand:+ start:57918 stop:58724 length:807 start_codon:yes stop_codon:yes gene_type:complete